MNARKSRRGLSSDDKEVWKQVAKTIAPMRSVDFSTELESTAPKINRADVAHAVLTQFILGAHGSGARLVLVITGKGRTHRDEGGVMPTRRGIIRHSVPDWLRQLPLRDKVVQVIPAHRKHGGDGAYYVYLRRKR